MAKKASYGNDDIVSLKGPDQVRKRPAVIFGSDGLDGCEHSVFEIISKDDLYSKAGLQFIHFPVFSIGQKRSSTFLPCSIFFKIFL